MSETLASRRSPGRSRGPERADGRAASAACAPFPAAAPGGGLREPREGGVERRSRLRVIGLMRSLRMGQSGGGSALRRIPVPIANDGRLRQGRVRVSECENEGLLARCHGSGFLVESSQRLVSALSVLSRIELQEASFKE